MGAHISATASGAGTPPGINRSQSAEALGKPKTVYVEGLHTQEQALAIVKRSK